VAWTTPSTVSDGQTISASFWNQQVRDNLDFLYATPATTIASRETTQSITAGVTTSVSFDLEVVDSVGGFAPTSTTITCKEDGIYLISYSLGIDSGPTLVQMGLAFNVVGSPTPDPATVQELSTDASVGTWFNGEFVKELNDTDTIQLTVFHSGGGATENIQYARLGIVSLGGL